MNYSRILIAGLAGIATAVIIKKMLNQEEESFEDIVFDSEFIPGTNKIYPPKDENQPHFRHSRLYSENADGPIFI